jgi:hypothetical protein
MAGEMYGRMEVQLPAQVTLALDGAKLRLYHVCVQGQDKRDAFPPKN